MKPTVSRSPSGLNTHNIYQSLFNQGWLFKRMKFAFMTKNKSMLFADLTVQRYLHEIKPPYALRWVLRTRRQLSEIKLQNPTIDYV